MSTKKKIFVTITVLFAMLGGFGVGMYVGAQNTVEAQIVRDAQEKLVTGQDVIARDRTEMLSGDEGRDVINFQLYWDVWETMRQYHTANQEITDQELFYGSLKGMVQAANDPYTVFFTPQEADDFETELEGVFDGIGAEIGVKDDRLTIISPLNDSPAEKAGLRAGDKVYYIDGFDTTGITVTDAVRRIRGQKDTIVTLTIGREGEPLLKDIEVSRDTIEIDSVVIEQISLNGSNYTHLIINSFSADTAEEILASVDQIMEVNSKGLILDLRNNPGGFLEESVDVASLWIENGDIVSEKYADGTKQSHVARGKSLFAGMPTIVLINRGSASASEILAGALQDYGVAVLVGEKSFGKGSVQSLVELPGGATLKITVAEWVTPKDRKIDQVGIEPDVFIEYTLEDFESEKDPQLDKAIELIQLSEDALKKYIVELQASQNE